jgi:DNA-binding SARP family transcriptional activator
MSLFIRLLGPVEIRHHDTVAPIRGPKRQAMLAALALSANRAVSLEALTETLWGDQAPASAMMNLRNHAYALRTVLDGRLVTRSGAYELQLDADELDTTLFTALADRGMDAVATGDTAGAVAAYGEALGLWRGVALQGVPRTVRLDAALAGLLDRRLAVYEDYCDARLAGGSASELVPDLRQHLASHPFRERAWGALMLAQYRSGDIPGALASFGQAQDLLRQQLGVDPGPDLMDLHQAVLARDPRLSVPPRVGRPGPPARLAQQGDRAMVGIDGLGYGQRACPAGTARSWQPHPLPQPVPLATAR